jgi:RNA polymerase sigma-70 factor (ECF subfamily)
VTSVINIHEELIERCRSNDRDAQFEVYRLYYKSMYNTALRIINDTAEAEDVMQESFLDAFRKIASFKGESGFGTWLRKIVINKSLDALRTSRDISSIDDIEDAGGETYEEENYLEALSYRVDMIKKAIHSLPDNYRIVLSLFLLEGYDHEEISQILGITNNVSRVRFLRAKSKLIEYLRSDQSMGKVFNA